VLSIIKTFMFIPLSTAWYIYLETDAPKERRVKMVRWAGRAFCP
jgi:hypothetical protein